MIEDPLIQSMIAEARKLFAPLALLDEEHVYSILKQAILNTPNLGYVEERRTTIERKGTKFDSNGVALWRSGSTYTKTFSKFVELKLDADAERCLRTYAKQQKGAHPFLRLYADEDPDVAYSTYADSLSMSQDHKFDVPSELLPTLAKSRYLKGVGIGKSPYSRMWRQRRAAETTKKK